MSNYFIFFPTVDYKFGDETTNARFKNISIYTDVLDQVADATSSYQDYFIIPGERPDHVSDKLYGTPEYHWTFYLMNDAIREQRWPVTDSRLYDLSLEKYSAKVITTRSKLTDKLKIAQTLSGGSSGATATIGKRNLDLGQLFLENVSGTFIAGENVNSTNANGDIETITIFSFTDQYNTVHHYENADGSYADIDPEVGPGVLLTGVTYFNRLEKLNTANRQLKVIKPTIINEVVRAFRDAVRS